MCSKSKKELLVWINFWNNTISIFVEEWFPPLYQTCRHYLLVDKEYSIASIPSLNDWSELFRPSFGLNYSAGYGIWLNEFARTLVKGEGEVKIREILVELELLLALDGTIVKDYTWKTR